MASLLREDSEGVASTIATLFTLLIALIFLQAAIISPIPAKQYEAEHLTSLEAIAAFEQLWGTVAGGAATDGHFTVTVPLGTAAVSPFAIASNGLLQFDTKDVAHANVSMSFVPAIHQGRVTRVDQDVLLLIDSSGSMQQNDPGRLRITGAKEYVDRLRYPDRIAVVDFDSVARLTKANVGGGAHHLYTPGHDGIPNYSEVKTDLDTIDQSGGTNFGEAIQVANDELLANAMKNHAWIEILLTDGHNNFPWQDTLARTEAQRAKVNGITIFTIGLGSDVDGPLLQDIAQTTGGTYYPAPDAASIRWIYFEISQRYQGFIACGTLTSANALSGSMSLTLGNIRYPSQTLRLEAGGITLTQPDGALVEEGIPLAIDRNGLGSWTLRLSVVSYIGDSFEAAGSDYQFITARFLHRHVDDQTIDRPNLGAGSREAGNISDYVEYWAQQGAATLAAAAAVRAPIERAEAKLLWGDANWTSGRPTLAKFNVDSAKAELSAAAAEADRQANSGAMQRWLAKSTQDQVLGLACALDQWQNWYKGVTFTINSPNAAAWAVWFNQTVRPTGAVMSFGASGTTAVLSVNAIDRLVVDERVVHLSLG
ncbi:MAG TPA: vWA domain-containing protein [Thermoplasmata archaeon]|nr:vWA domain-containing protein [Thermoplasmata archaeon]